MKNFLVSKFSNYTAKRSNGTINIWSWLLNDDDYLKAIVEEIRSSSNEEEKKDLKSKLPAITPSGIFRERRASMLQEHSGLICIDIDGKENPHISDWEIIKSELEELAFIMYVGLSVGGKGLFCLIKLAYPDRHAQHFKALHATFKEMGITIDNSCGDVSRLRGYSYDPQPFVNPTSSLYYDLVECDNLKSTPRQKGVTPRSQVDLPTAPRTDMQPKTDEELMELLLNPPAMEAGVEVLIKPLRVKIDELIEEVLQTQRDITVAYKDWFTICCILANRFDEEGRERFHQLSQFYPNYTREECDMKFSECLTSQYFYKSNLLFEIARRYGL